MTTTLTSTPAETAEQEQCLVLSSISWQQYELVLQAFPEQAGLRITYLDGRMTILSPKRRHDWHEWGLGRIVEAVASGLGIEWEPSGHTTYRQEDIRGGVEGDETFYFVLMPRSCVGLWMSTCRYNPLPTWQSRWRLRTAQTIPSRSGGGWVCPRSGGSMSLAGR